MTAGRDWQGPHVMYRCYDGNGDLIYVGASSNMATRIYFHEHMTPWWGDVDRVDMREFPTRREAFRAEAAAILATWPTHNRKVGSTHRDSVTT